MTTIVAGSKIVITKGCEARRIRKGMVAIVRDVTPGDRGSARLSIFFPSRVSEDRKSSSSVVSFYVSHTNRLADGTVGMNDGNPMHRIEARCA